MINNPWGNAMLKYLVFNKLIRTLGFHNSKISNFILPDWQIKHNSLEHEKKFNQRISLMVSPDQLPTMGTYFS